MSESGRKPLWRNAYVIGFLAGAAIITLFVPRFRRVAPPPDVTGTVTPFTLRDAQGRAFGIDRLRGRVTLVALHSAREPEAWGQAAEAFDALPSRLQVAKADVQLVELALDPVPAASPKWTTVSGDDACRLACQAFGCDASMPACDGAAKAARDARLALIDADGNVRGTHGSSPVALPETFERTLRVCDLATGGR